MDKGLGRLRKVRSEMDFSELEEEGQYNLRETGNGTTIEVIVGESPEESGDLEGAGASGAGEGPREARPRIRTARSRRRRSGTDYQEEKEDPRDWEGKARVRFEQYMEILSQQMKLLEKRVLEKNPVMAEEAAQLPDRVMLWEARDVENRLWRRRSERKENESREGERKWERTSGLVGKEGMKPKGVMLPTTVDCFYCKEQGRLKRDCPKLTAKAATGGEKKPAMRVGTRRSVEMPPQPPVSVWSDVSEEEKEQSEEVELDERSCKILLSSLAGRRWGEIKVGEESRWTFSLSGARGEGRKVFPEPRGPG